MHRRYNACCPPQRRLVAQGQCCIPSAATSVGAGANPGAIPESARMQTNACEAWVTTNIPITCVDGNTSAAGATSRIEKITVPVVPGSAPPVVPVATLSASLTTQYKASQVLTNASNPYDPATRFAQYFPPQPPGVPCPERIPNPAPPERPCVPITRFRGSEYEHAQALAEANGGT